MIEIERKFLLAGDGWRAAADQGVAIRQGYLTSEPGLSVRVRAKGERGYLTIKAGRDGMFRHEYEYEIPLVDAAAMLNTLAKPYPLIKRRYHVRHGAHLWEIDVFEGDNEGLVMAEVELQAANEKVELPPWVGPEVTGDPRFFNTYLAQRPFKTWRMSYRDLLAASVR